MSLMWLRSTLEPWESCTAHGAGGGCGIGTCTAPPATEGPPPKLEESSVRQRSHFFGCFVPLKLQRGSVSQPWIRPFVFLT